MASTFDAAAIRHALASTLGAVSGLNVSEWLGTNPQLPAALVFPQAGSYWGSIADPGNSFSDWIVQLLAGVFPEQAAQVQLDAWMSVPNAVSIPALLQADTHLGGVASAVQVRGFQRYGSFQFGDVPCLGVEFLVRVWT